MLSAILVVTLVVADLDSTRSAYVDWLDYQIVAEDSVSSELAASWAAPAAAGSRSVLLQPASGGTMWLRLIERPHAAGYRAMQSTGWTANEILVEDPFDLAERFSKPGSPFRVVGPPAPLGSNGKVIAMQAIGPAGELNYFTRIPPEGGTFIKTPAAGRVDRTFIAVVTGSLGSRNVNEAVLAALPKWSTRTDLAIRHVIGSRDWDSVQVRLPQTEGLEYVAVRYEDGMETVLAAADLLIGRAGGTTVAELAEVGVASG